MTPSSSTCVRLLAAWLQQRRELTDRVEGLLLHGPTAVRRVGSRVEELRAGQAAEREALDAFVAALREQEQAAAAGPPDPPPDPPPAPAAGPGPAPPDAYPPLRSVGSPS